MTANQDNPETAVNSLFQRAVAAFRHGHHDEAKMLALKLLMAAPAHDGTHCLLGLSATQNGQYSTAEKHLGLAIKENPGNPFYHFQLGVALQLAGKPDAAVTAYEKCIGINPEYADAYNNLANALKCLGRNEEAIAACAKAIELMPKSAEAHFNHGCLLDTLGQKADALHAFERAIQLRPGHAQSHFYRGNLLRNLGQYEAAIESYTQANRLRPGYLEALNNLGALLREQGKPEMSLTVCSQAAEISGKSSATHSNLGNALRDLGRLEEAVEAYQMAIRLDPQHAQAHIGLGVALKEMGRLEEALAASEEAIRLWPGNAEAHNNHAMYLLQSGDFKNGWREYEWRKQMGNYPHRNFQVPQWDGSPLHGKTILLHAEQGYGDSIQFIRFIPLVAASGARIVVECQPALKRLFSCFPDVAMLLQQGERLPPLDCHAPLMSLPYILEITLDAIPDTVPYLSAPHASTITGRAGIDKGKRNIGITWAGNPKNPGRSVNLSLFRTLFGIPGTRWISLQVGTSASDIGTLPGTGTVIDAGKYLGDFGDTAALIKELDLVISVDTAVAHLAGALGKPTWLLLPHIPEWRWLLGREDSPWYPGMRLFTQPVRGDWGTVFGRIYSELRQ